VNIIKNFDTGLGKMKKFFLLFLSYIFCADSDSRSLKSVSLHEAVNMVTSDRTKSVSSLLYMINSEVDAKVVLCSLIIKHVQDEEYFKSSQFYIDLDALQLGGNQYFNDLLGELLDKSPQSSLGRHLFNFDFLYLVRFYSKESAVINDLIEFMNNSCIFTWMDHRVLWFFEIITKHLSHLLTFKKFQKLSESGKIDWHDQIPIISRLLRGFFDLFMGRGTDSIEFLEEKILRDCARLEFDLSKLIKQITGFKSNAITCEAFNIVSKNFHNGNPRIFSDDFKIYLSNYLPDSPRIAHPLAISENNHRFSSRSQFEALIMIIVSSHSYLETKRSPANSYEFLKALLSAGNFYIHSILTSTIYPLPGDPSVSFLKFLERYHPHCFYTKYPSVHDYRLKFMYDMFDALLFSSSGNGEVKFFTLSRFKSALNLMKHPALESILGDFFDAALEYPAYLTKNLKEFPYLKLSKVLRTCLSADINRAKSLLSHEKLYFENFFVDQVKVDSSGMVTNYSSYVAALIIMLPKELQDIILPRLKIDKLFNVSAQIYSDSRNLTTKCIYLYFLEGFNWAISIDSMDKVSLPDSTLNPPPYVIVKNQFQSIIPSFRDPGEALAVGDVIYVFPSYFGELEITLLRTLLAQLLTNHGGSLIYLFCEFYDFNAFLVTERLHQGNF
jgi:hypothetical protein